MSIRVDEILPSKGQASSKRSLDQNGIDGLSSKYFKSDKENVLEDDVATDVPDTITADELDEAGVKRIMMSFEKKASDNQEQRIKFADQPEKFMSSEEALHVAIQEMHAVATVPELYYLLTESNVLEILIQLLLHDNTDISGAVINLLQELTDVEDNAVGDAEESTRSLVDALLRSQAIGLLVQTMDRMNESSSDEADYVHNGLSVVENIIELRPEACKLSVEQGLLSWLLKRLKVRGHFDGVKLYCSEILAVLVQNDDSVKKAVGQAEGIDILLQQLAAYKRNNPKSLDEIEFMENLFNSLCACLMDSENRLKFLKGEGLQLMNLMLREKKQSRASALKVLDYAVSGPDGAENADKFVEILGLRTIFPLFMKTPAKSHRKGYSAQSHEEHVIGVLSSLLLHCSSSKKQRVLNKFNEQDFAKVERLMELHFNYVERVKNFEAKYANEESELEEEELYLRKLDSGLFVLQLLDYVIAELAVAQTALRKRILYMLRMRGGSMKAIRMTLQEFAENMVPSDVAGKEDRVDGETAKVGIVKDRDRILNLVDWLKDD